MNSSSKCLAIASAMCAGVLSLASSASAQNLVQNASWIARTGDPVPDSAGVPLPGLVFGGTATFGFAPVLHGNGSVYFRGKIQGPGVDATNDAGMFYGLSKSDLKMAMREGGPAPGFVGGEVIDVIATSFAAIGTPNGTTLTRFSLVNGVGGVTTADDTAIVGGPAAGPMQIYVREGMACPGTAGATFGAPAIDLQSIGINDSGTIVFKQATLGGDTVTTGIANNEAWFTGTPGSLALVLRKGDQVLGTEFVASLGVSAQMNPSGQFVHEVTLGTTAPYTGAGATATADNDSCLFVYDPVGNTNTLLVREGMVAPGTAGATMVDGPDSFTQYFIEWYHRNGFTRDGRVLFQTELAGGDVTGTTNDLATYIAQLVAGVPTLTLVVREGQPAPGTSSTIKNLNATNHGISETGVISFCASLAGGDVTGSNNDEAYYVGLPGFETLVAREGDLAPSAGGTRFGNMLGVVKQANDLGQILFTNSLLDPDLSGGYNGQSWYLYDPTDGLQPVAFTSFATGGALADIVTVAPATQRRLDGSLSTVAGNDSTNASMSFSHGGRFAWTGALYNEATFETELAVATLQFAHYDGVPYCSGDGSGTFCPCSPAPVAHGAANRGCPNNLFPTGAALTSSGTASITADTFALQAQGMPNGGGCLFFQGTNNNGGGLGAVFGDGLRCVAGTVRRMPVKTVALNAASYPQMGDNSISVRCAVIAAGNRYYQGWYRSANPSFCTVATFNLTNGLRMTWVN